VIELSWRSAFTSPEVHALRAQGFGRDIERPAHDWWGQITRHSLGWVCARSDGRLVGWVNLARDGHAHATILDTVVDTTHRHRGIATELIEHAATGARQAGCTWLHVDFEHHLTRLYLEACRFRPTTAGLLALQGEQGLTQGQP
jgi:GNAT superfamily N-acetyltransferase